jgi:hypothetical protein
MGKGSYKPASLGFSYPVVGRPLMRLWQSISALSGALWTASGVIASGGHGRLFFADPTTAPEAPWSLEETERDVLPQSGKGLELSALRPRTAEEVKRDVLLVQQQIQTIANQKNKMLRRKAKVKKIRF